VNIEEGKAERAGGSDGTVKNEKKCSCVKRKIGSSLKCKAHDRVSLLGESVNKGRFG